MKNLLLSQAARLFGFKKKPLKVAESKSEMKSKRGPTAVSWAF